MPKGQRRQNYRVDDSGDVWRRCRACKEWVHQDDLCTVKTAIKFDTMCKPCKAKQWREGRDKNETRRREEIDKHLVGREFGGNNLRCGVWDEEKKKYGKKCKSFDECVERNELGLPVKCCYWTREELERGIMLGVNPIFMVRNK